MVVFLYRVQGRKMVANLQIGDFCVMIKLRGVSIFNRDASLLVAGLPDP